MLNRLPYELFCPGTWLDFPDQELVLEISDQLLMVENAFKEAALAWLLFEQFRSTEVTFDWDEMERQRTRKQQITQGVEKKRLDSLSQIPLEPVSIEAHRAFLQEQREQGIIPPHILYHRPFLYAKAFLYAADEAGRILLQLAKEPKLPPSTIKACREYYDFFSTLRALRNSSLYVEDRIRRLGRGGKPLDLKPISGSGMDVPATTLVIGSLSDNRFGASMADGTFGEIEVSARTLVRMRDCIEAVLGSLPWRGWARLIPD